MTEQQEDFQQSKDHQLDEIWQKVLGWVSLSQSFSEVLLRKYGNLQTFDETSACIRLRLFSGARRVRLHKGHLKNSVKVVQNQKLFVAILKYVIADPSSIKYQFTQFPIPENWLPCKDEIVLWIQDGKELPCRFKRVRPMIGDKRLKATVDNCECEIIKIVTTETISSVNYLFNKYQYSFYVPLSELRPSQSLGLNVVETVEAMAPPALGIAQK